MERNGLKILFVLVLCVADLALAERWRPDKSPAIMLRDRKDAIFELSRLPTEGVFSKKVWHAKNWKTVDGGFLKRRDGSIGGCDTCAPDILSPVEKLDLCAKRRGNVSTDYVRMEKIRIGDQYLNSPKWDGVCDDIKRLQLIFDEPEAVDIEQVHFDKGEVLALQCLYLQERYGTEEDLIDADCEVEGSLVNAGTFHVVLSNFLGFGDSFIYIPEVVNNQEREVYNELVLNFTSRIVERKQESVRVQTQMKVLTEDAQGEDKVEIRNLEYRLEIENGNLVGGSWLSGTKGPRIIWKPRADSVLDRKMRSRKYLKAFL